jgi:N6-L-threonylcarbamoyladenine synthase
LRVLGFDTSCDETAAAVVDGGRTVLSSVVSSRLDLHAPYGGIVPEIAGREHVRVITVVLERALEEAGTDLGEIDAVAVTNRPGLIGSLLVGLSAAKAVALARDLPFLGVNHIEAHIASTWLSPGDVLLPAVALVVSGGHTSLFRVEGPGDLVLLGGTIDDAAGEAFDKVAAMLELGYPGGPAVEQAARQGDPKAIRFPRSMLGDGTDDFSFSGLKTSVLYRCMGQNVKASRANLKPGIRVEDVAASFQQAVVDVLIGKTLVAARREGARSVLAGGGVTANRALREALERACAKEGLDLRLPGPGLSTDNAAMVAAAAHPRLVAGERDDLDLDAHARMR